ncbi:MAG: hypothetical protein P1V35_16990 [Planctomycetota bacterium]|nr:hypothetical protein [Planctomycetota bacterium]
MNSFTYVFKKTLQVLSRRTLGNALILAGLIGISGPAQGQGISCNGPTPISGQGQWTFFTECCPNQQWTVLGCGGFDDTARFWKWEPLSSGNYTVYTSGFGGSSFAISSSLDCATARQHVIACSVFSDAPIILGGITGGDDFLIEVTTDSNGLQRMLHIEKMICSASDFVDDGLEENDSIANATVMVEGVHPNLAVRFDDPDFYQVLIPAGEELRVKANTSASDVRVSLYDFQGQIVSTELSGQVAAHAPGANVSRRAFIRVDIPNVAGVANCSTYDLHIATHPILQSLQTFCDPAIPNSTGSSTELVIVEDRLGPHTDAVLFAFAQSGPPNQFGYLVAGDQVQQLGLPMGAQPICIGGNIARYNVGGTRTNSIGVFNANGYWWSLAGHNLILAQPPYWWRYAYPVPEQLPSGLGTLTVGQSWGFQLWHRESGGGSSTSNGVLVNW